MNASGEAALTRYGVAPGYFSSRPFRRSMMLPSIPSWAAEYIGLPFCAHGRSRNGADCWGLVRLILAGRFGLVLPSYAEGYETVEDAAEIGRLIRGEMVSWRPVPWEAARAGDVVLMRLLGQPMHVGVVVAPGWMLHIEDGIDSCLERYDGAKWRRRVLGIYRHAAFRHRE